LWSVGSAAGAVIARVDPTREPLINLGNTSNTSNAFLFMILLGGFGLYQLMHRRR
jgi:hypothetical protein